MTAMEDNKNIKPIRGKSWDNSPLNPEAKLGVDIPMVERVGPDARIYELLDAASLDINEARYHEGLVNQVMAMSEVAGVDWHGMTTLLSRELIARNRSLAKQIIELMAKNLIILDHRGPGGSERILGVNEGNPVNQAINAMANEQGIPLTDPERA